MIELINVKELSSYFHVHPNTVYKWIREKKIPHHKINGIIRFKKEEIDNWVKQNKAGSDQIAALLPKLDLSLDRYDKILLKRRTELKDQIRWTYGIGSVVLRKTKNKEDRYYIDYQIDKHKVRKALKGVRTRSEAVKVLNSEVADTLRGKYHFNKKKIIFSEMADLFLEKYSKPKKRSWRSADKVYIRNLKSFFGNTQLTKITPLMIEDYKIKRLENGRGRRAGEKVSNSTINRELQCLRKIFNKAIDWGYANKNPVTKVDFLQEKTSLRDRELTEEEEVLLFEAAPLYLKNIMIVALYTGMRRGEVLNLRWENVDFEERTIKIVETKDNEDRTVPMNSEVFNLLYALRSKNGKSEYVFPNPKTGKPYVDIKRAFNNACRKAGIEDLHFHDLRHTFASRLVRSGCDLNTVKDLMGHSSITTTQRYLHSLPRIKREAVEALAGQRQKFYLQYKQKKNVKSEHIDVEENVVYSFLLIS